MVKVASLRREQDLKVKRATHAMSGGRVLQGKGTTNAKALRTEHACCLRNKEAASVVGESDRCGGWVRSH